MMKYGVVGAIALAVLVAAMWDGSKSKKKPQDGIATDTSGSETSISGEVGGATRATFDSKGPTVAENTAPRHEEDVLEKYQVKKGETLRGIAKAWLGDEKLAESLYEANKSRIPDVKHLSAHLTLVFPRSKFAKKNEPVGSPQNATVPAGLKKDEVKPTTEPAGDKKYVVKEGDTLYGIAKRELGKGTRWEEIASLNHLDGNMVKKGQTLVLPSR